MDKWPAIDPGELRHLVTIQKPVESQDASGARLQTWVTFKKVRVKIDAFGGGEKWGDATLQTTNLYKLWMRYVPGLTTAMRVLYNDRYFDIKNIENVLEMNLVNVLKCLERTADTEGRRIL